LKPTLFLLLHLGLLNTRNSGLLVTFPGYTLGPTEEKLNSARSKEAGAWYETVTKTNLFFLPTITYFFIATKTNLSVA
jgi:hypothetical protein